MGGSRPLRSVSVWLCGALFWVAAGLGVFRWCGPAAGMRERSFSGWSAEWLGDCNGDGIAEIVLVTPFEPAGSLHGRARVLCGATGTVLHTIEGVQQEPPEERRIKAAGDVDGDGRADLLHGDAQGTRVLSSAGWRTLASRNHEEGRGRFAAAGDIDGDGHGDWILGEPRDETRGRRSGVVRVISGRDQRVIDERFGDVGEQAGWSVAGLGDTDGDGADDFGIVFWNDFRWPSSRVEVISGKTREVLLRIDYESAPFGPTLTAAGDIDGDGLGDIVLACAGAVVLDVHSGLTGRRLHQLEVDGPLPRSFWGFTGIGDLDKDGHDDIAAGAGSGILVYSGATGKVLRTLANASLGFGRCDFDGDGHADLLVTRNVWSEQEQRPLDELWDRGRLEVHSGRDGAVLLGFDASRLR